MSCSIGQTFIFNSKEYKYFQHQYNEAGTNERTIEVPIIRDIVVSSKGSILEVGNVLSHYYSVSHPIVDLYEQAPGVINSDICTYKAETTFDLIVSISTLEHIGDIDQINNAFKNLLKLLSPIGQIWFTIPVNQNSYYMNSFTTAMNSYIKELDKYIMTRYYLYAIKRISRENEWVQIDISEVWDCRYNVVYNNASGVVIGNISNVAT